MRLSSIISDKKGLGICGFEPTLNTTKYNDMIYHMIITNHHFSEKWVKNKNIIQADYEEMIQNMKEDWFIIRDDLARAKIESFFFGPIRS